MFPNLGHDLLAARTTLALAGLLFLIHLVVELRGGFETAWGSYEAFGLTRDGVFEGKVWQLLTHGLLHGNWLHLGLNVLALLAVGSRLERIGGPSLMLRMLLAGLLGGGLAQLTLSGPNAWPLVGLSGALFAAILCLTGISPGSRMWPLPISGRNLGLGVLLASALLASLNPQLGWGAWSAWGGQLDSLTQGGLFSTSHACHLGGAVAGILGARWLLRPTVSLEQLRADRLRREGSSEMQSTDS
jgi:membrane associated rhomboid family serine protease